MAILGSLGDLMLGNVISSGYLQTLAVFSHVVIRMYGVTLMTHFLMHIRLPLYIRFAISNGFSLLSFDSQEIDKRKKIEEAYKLLLGDKPKRIVMGGPDYEVISGQ